VASAELSQLLLVSMRTEISKPLCAQLLKGVRCAVYSVPSDETPNGYSHSSIAVSKTVREEFGGIYPEEFLLPAIKRIEDMGPWTEDESELIFE